MKILSSCGMAAILLVAACGESNPPELNAAAQKAADAYCDCVKTEAAKSPAELAATKNPCQKEEKAYKDAWAALPVAGRDPKAEPIFTYQHACYNILSDARSKALDSAPAKP